MEAILTFTSTSWIGILCPLCASVVGFLFTAILPFLNGQWCVWLPAKKSNLLVCGFHQRHTGESRTWSRGPVYILCWQSFPLTSVKGVLQYIVSSIEVNGEALKSGCDSVYWTSYTRNYSLNCVEMVQLYVNSSGSRLLTIALYCLWIVKPFMSWIYLAGTGWSLWISERFNFYLALSVFMSFNWEFLIRWDIKESCLERTTVYTEQQENQSQLLALKWCLHFELGRYSLAKVAVTHSYEWILMCFQCAWKSHCFLWIILGMLQFL